MGMIRPFLLLPLCALSLTAQALTPDEVLAKAKAAHGGAALALITSLHSRGSLEAGGQRGSFQALEDLRTGRSVQRYELGLQKGASGYDGRESWTEDGTGDARAEEDEQARKDAVKDAYFTRLAYWFPERGRAAIRYLGEREEKDRRFHVLSIEPEGGSRAELWVDGRTWLVDRMVSITGGLTSTTSYTDYRPVEGAQIAFQMRSSIGDPQYDNVMRYEEVRVNVPVKDGDFAMPAQRVSDAGIEGDKALAVLPLEFRDHELYVEVKLNGKGPFRLALDTGGGNCLTPTAMKSLGLSPEGSVAGGGAGEKIESYSLVKVDRVQLGEAWMKNQTFLVIPALEELSRKSDTTSDGVIGYELFRRFITRVEFVSRRLTLSRPAGWVYQGNGTAVPFAFNAHRPQVQGELDGIPGKFDLDTGSGATLDVYSPFVTRHDLVAKAKVAYRSVTGSGTGGDSYGYTVRARELKLGDVSMKNPVIHLITDSKGAFAAEGAAGNVGLGFLKRFDLTFDYTKQSVFFEKNALYNEPDRWSMSGFILKVDGEVKFVFPNSPAEEAGLKAGDRVRSINGKVMEACTPGYMQKLFLESPVGTRVVLDVQSGSQVRTMELVLRDLI